MKFISLISLSTLALASPIALPEDQLSALDTRATGTTAKEFTLQGCRDIIFIFARGSTEAGNMGGSVGPAVSDQLKSRFGERRVATEGVDYAALLSTNFLPGGADPAGITEMKSLITSAASKCPNAQIVVGGYSQGAALTHRAVENLSADLKARINAAVTFGDTQNQQDGGRIKNFPTEKTKIICNTGDAVCSGTLTILAPHLDYVRRAPEAVSFIATRVS